MSYRKLAGRTWLAVPLAVGLVACHDNDVDFITPTAGDTFALTSSNRLVSFNLAERSVRTTVAISGLQAGETLHGIDRRPANGALVAVGSSGRIYTIDAASGAATSTASLNNGATPPVALALTGTHFGVDFNPVPDRLRVVSNSGQNLRINVDTGATTVDGALTLNSAAVSGVTAAAYTNSFGAACRTTLYYLDTTADRLLTTSAPNDGLVTVVGALGVDADAVDAFDIRTAADGSNTAVAALRVGGTVGIYSINLGSGAATLAGAVTGLNAGESISGLAMPLPDTAPTQAKGELFGLTESNKLVTFNRTAPAKLCTSSAAIAPLNTGESVVGIDFRPSTGALHALANANGTARLLTLNPDTGAVTGSAAISQALVGTDFGMDFNPTGPVALRIVSDTGQNLRVTDVAAGTTVADGALNGAGTGATAAAYTNSVAGTAATTLYVLDTANGNLRIQNPPNAGTLVDVGPLGVAITGVNGFDIDGRDNVALVAATTAGATASSLYTLNLSTGALSASLGAVGGGERLRGLARPTPATTVFGVTSGNSLVQVSLADPSQVTTVGAVTGLVGENLLDIDFRPSTGLLYGLGSNGGLYTISTTNASAVRVALNPNAGDAFSALDGTAFGADFNPTGPVAFRIVSNTGQNLRVSNPVAGTTITDTPLSRAPFTVTAAAYTNSVPGATSTAMYVIDIASDRLLRQNPPNDGVLRAIGPLGVDAQSVNGFDIVGADTAIAGLTVGGVASLYSINLATGAATVVGLLPAGGAVSLAAPISATPPAANSTLFGVNATNMLFTFARNAPATSTLVGAITGLAMGETVLGIDFRPSTSELWALGSGGNLYIVDTGSAVATLQSTLSGATLAGTAFGVDFNPTGPVALRIVSNTGQNLRVGNPVAGTTVVDTALNVPAAKVTSAAYTNSFPGAVATQMYVIDGASAALLLQNPPNNGVLNFVGALSLADTYSEASGFDIAGGDNGIVLAALQKVPETQSRLYRINLETGAATEVGAIAGDVLSGLAVRVQ